MRRQFVAHLVALGCAPAGTILAIALLSSCTPQTTPPAKPQPKAYGSAIVEISGANQAGAAGSLLDRPVVVLVTDAEDSPIAGAPVEFAGPAGVIFAPASGLTDSDGQLSTTVVLGTVEGRYLLTASSWDRTGKEIRYDFEALALDCEQVLGRQLNELYCARCHDPESSPARVSNYMNLSPQPAPFSQTESLRKFRDEELTRIITRGGAAVGRSPQMPPWGHTLSKSDIEALVSYIRAVSAPAAGASMK